MKKRIAIIGGGISGLSAANLLVRAGCDVILLEAKAGFGGRIWSIRNGGPLIELGAEFLHGESGVILNTIRAAELTTHQLEDDYQFFQDGAFVSVPSACNIVIAKSSAFSSKLYQRSRLKFGAASAARICV